MSLDLRAITPAELAAYQNSMTRTMMGSDTPARMVDELREWIEFDRTLAVFEGTEVVATAGAFSFQMTTVGKVVPAAGVTRVTVRPTHRRQGLLTRMMRRQLDDCHERGEPLAILWASEAVIYGRFGYGVATYAADLELARGAQFWRPVQVRGRIAGVAGDRAREVIPALVDRIAPTQPGMINRERRWWALRIEDSPEFRRGERDDLNLVVVDLGSGPTGYAAYRIHTDWTHGPQSTVSLSDLMAEDPESYAVLWRFILDLDLVTTISAPNRPATEPLRNLLANRRAGRVRTSDAIWLRLVDVQAALAGRRYLQSGSLRIEVKDSFCGWNQGVYELEAGPVESACSRSSAAPQLVLDADALAAAYLGSNTFRELAAAGRVEAREAGVLELADGLFRAPVPAWCPFHF